MDTCHSVRYDISRVSAGHYVLESGGLPRYVPRGAALETGSPCDAGCLGLDQLSQWLKSEEELGYAVIFSLIFLTTIREYLMQPS